MYTIFQIKLFLQPLLSIVFLTDYWLKHRLGNLYLSILYHGELWPPGRFMMCLWIYTSHSRHHSFFIEFIIQHLLMFFLLLFFLSFCPRAEGAMNDVVDPLKWFLVFYGLSYEPLLFLRILLRINYIKLYVNVYESYYYYTGFICTNYGGANRTFKNM